MEDEQIIKLIGGKTIIIVDDHELARKSLRGVLKKFKINVLEAESFLEAAETMDSQLVDLILMDLQMPEIYGVDATKIIRSGKCFKNFKNFKKIPIIAFTASTNPETIKTAFESGMNDAFIKGSYPKELINILVKWLSKTI